MTFDSFYKKSHDDTPGLLRIHLRLPSPLLVHIRLPPFPHPKPPPIIHPLHDKLLRSHILPRLGQVHPSLHVHVALLVLYSKPTGVDAIVLSIAFSAVGIHLFLHRSFGIEVESRAKGRFVGEAGFAGGGR
eukprot:CAMPEP_0196175472 /NCGR_PEP_ID=MMETSP0911-20130528/8085_1 /TAXON_ID=49265 /ORGANISM="Thalassiosira rotula, Strain GSO102" /LENGTH=130 /DNA_ID=CAMNT_0041443025 /DNA_START=110 /DNA_END=499 /DNA_ORIENTATION=-